MINVSTFKGKVAPKLHGTNLSKVAGVYDKMSEASGIFLSNVRPYSTIRKFRIQNAIYDKITNYVCEDDVFIDGIIDIRPVGRRSKADFIDGTFNQEFDIKKAENTYVIEEINGVKTLRLSKCLTPQITLADLNSLSDGQTVTGSGDVTDLDVDYTDYISGQASIRFGLTGITGQGIITLNLANAVDLSRYINNGSILEWFQFSDVTKLTNVKLRAGSDASNYYESIVTQSNSGAFEDDTWMILNENLQTAIATGSTDLSDLSWMQIEINYTVGSTPTAKLDSITAAIGQQWEVVYYSNRMFTDVTGRTWKDTPTVDTDIIRLDDTADITAYVYSFMLTLQQELKGKNMAADFSYFTKQLEGQVSRDGTVVSEGLFRQIQNKYPNQSVIRTTTYYNFGDYDDDYGYDDGDNFSAPIPPIPYSNGGNIASQFVTAIASGNNVQIDLTQLTNNFQEILFITKNGQIMNMGIPNPNDFTSQWSRSGDIVTVYTASVSDSYFIQYRY